MAYREAAENGENIATSRRIQAGQGMEREDVDFRIAT
jgi:hypothetical protein